MLDPNVYSVFLENEVKKFSRLIKTNIDVEVINERSYYKLVIRSVFDSQPGYLLVNTIQSRNESAYKIVIIKSEITGSKIEREKVYEQEFLDDISLLSNGNNILQIIKDNLDIPVIFSRFNSNEDRIITMSYMSNPDYILDYIGKTDNILGEVEEDLKIYTNNYTKVINNLIEIGRRTKMETSEHYYIITRNKQEYENFRIKRTSFVIINSKMDKIVIDIRGYSLDGSKEPDINISYYLADNLGRPSLT